MKDILTAILLLLLTKANCQSVAEGLYRQAKTFDSLGNTIKAVEYYTKTIEVDPKWSNAYFNRGSILAQQKKYTEALSDFKIFDQLSPDDFEVQYLMAACNYYLGDKSVSFTLVNKSLKRKEPFFDALKLRGTIYLERGEPKEAIEDLNKALLIRANDYDIYYMRGFCYEALNDNTNALNSYLKAEGLGYSNDVVFNNIGNLFTKQNDFNKALIYFGKAININNKFALAYYNQGIAYDQLGFTESALNSLRMAKELGFSAFNKRTLEVLNRN